MRYILFGALLGLAFIWGATNRIHQDKQDKEIAELKAQIQSLKDHTWTNPSKP